MFDLFRSRAKAVRYLLGAVLLLVALSMVITLIPGFGSAPISQEGVVAEVGGDVITARDVQLAIHNIQRRGTVPEGMLQHFVPQIVDQLITERALAFQAERLGMKVSESDIAQMIRMIMPQLFQGGQFAGKDVYAAVLGQQNLSIQDFEASIARQVLVDRLRSIALQGVVVSPQEIEQAYRERNEKVKLEYVRIAPDQFRPQVQVTPAQVREQYDKNKTAYRISEKRSLDLLIVEQAKLEATLNIPEEELLRVYKADQDRFRTPERVHVRHILLSTAGKPKEEEAKIKAKAESVLKQVKGGADFAKLAQENSDDPGSKIKGGDLGWVVRSQTVPEFEKAAFSLNPKQFSDLVQTQYGFHILQVLEKEQARLRSFDEVKGELAAELKKQRVVERMQALADTVEAELRKTPTHPAQVAANLNVQHTRVDRIAPGDPIPVIGANQEFTDLVFGAKQGDVIQPVPIGGTQFVVAVVSEITPAHQAEFDEVEAQIRNSLIAEKANQMANQRAEELAARTKSMNGDLRKAAQSLGIQVKTSDEVTRNGAIEGVGSVSMLTDAFTKSAGTVVGPVPLNDARVVYKVLARIPSDMSQLAAQRDTLRDEIKGSKARQQNTLFEDSIKQALRDRGKIKIYQDAVQRLMSNYAG